MFKILAQMLGGDGARDLVMNVKNISFDLWGDGARDLVMNVKHISPDPWV